MQLLSACSPDSGQVAAVAVPEQIPPGDTQVAEPAAPTLPVPTVTVHELMKDIQPAATGLWTAVSYVVSAQGTQETAPQTDADWQALRSHADILLQASAMLQLPGLRVTTGAMTTPAYQFTPSEIEQALSANPVPWQTFTEDMRTATLQILGAIERRDLLEYTQLGATLNEACENCHARYWYRPQSMRGAEGLR
jgi:hypothetical protein